MAEIHDQFDTILILDFGSQVCGKSPKICFFLSWQVYHVFSIVILLQEDVESTMYMRNLCRVPLYLKM